MCGGQSWALRKIEWSSLAVVQHEAVCRRLMTVPGVGPVAALSFKVGVDDPLRFTRSRTVGAHFGLTPRRHQSGTSIDYEGRITKQGDVSVREALCEAAASLLLMGWSGRAPAPPASEAGKGRQR